MVLTLRSSGEEAKTLRFERETVVVGADDLCDVVIAQDGVDPRQAVLIPRETHVDLFDIGVSGGILVNGQRVTHAELTPSDELWIGSTVLHATVGDTEPVVAITEMPSTVRAEEAPSEASAVPEPWAADNRFALLDRVRKLINSIGSDEDIFESILDVLFDSVPVRRGFLALLTGDGKLTIRAHRNREKGGNPDETISVSRTLLNKVIESGKAVLTSDAEADPELAMARSIHQLRIRAATAVPLKGNGRVIGIAYGDNREKPGALTRDHLSILNALASVASVAVEKMRLLQEFEAKQQIEQALRIARGIQRTFLPDAPPSVEGYDLAGYSESCDETGGDYYDYFVDEEGGLSFVVADVTGHGVGSALLMATVRAALRALIRTEEKLGDLFFQLNNTIAADLRDGRFVTCFMVKVDVETGRIEHVGAGHTPPIVYRADGGETEIVTNGAPPLGIFAGMDFPEGEPFSLQPGDVMLTLTDGLVEAARADGEMFGLDRLRRELTASSGGTAREIVERIQAAVDEWTGGEKLRDDATLVVLKRG
ncbi:MAG: SpoIIE family protein phosphatase [Planctomycetota bacterium]|jgi:sigma-B regulation protein RsbU (phosphoserine phosphatase)